jgi:hypothetical protein
MKWTTQEWIIPIKRAINAVIRMILIHQLDVIAV